MEVLSKILRVILILVILVVLTLILYLIWKPLFFWQLIPWLANKIVLSTGMNIWLARILVIPLAFLLVLATALMCSLEKRSRLVGFVLFCLIVFVGNMGMYQLTKEHHFKLKTGESIQWYIKTPQGFRLYSTSGHDVITGEKLEKVTPEIAKEIELWKGKEQKVIKPVQEKYHFFDVFTGESLRWYYKDEKGKIEIFDKPGFHPTTSDKLLPVTKKIVKEYLKQVENKVTIKKAPEKTQDKPKEKTQEKTEIIKPPLIKSPPEKIEIEEEENNIAGHYVETIDSYLRFDFIGFERVYCEDCRAHIKKIADAVFRLTELKSPKSVDVLIRLWEQMYCIKGFYREAIETVSNIPVLLASIGTPEALQFIEYYIREIEAEESQNKTVRNFQGILVKEIDFKIARTRYSYHGEEIMIKIIDTLKKHEPDSREIKNLLTLIADRASSQKVRTYASNSLVQH